MYCEDCRQEVEILIVWDWYGDPSVPMGVCEFQRWYCSECGSENIRDKQSADPVIDRRSARKDRELRH